MVMQLKNEFLGILLALLIVSFSGCIEYLPIDQSNQNISLAQAQEIAQEYADKYGVVPGVPNLQNDIFTVPLYRNNVQVGQVSIDANTGQVIDAYVNP